MKTYELSAIEIAAKVRSGEIKAQQVLEETLAIIKAVDGQPGVLDGVPLTAAEEQKVHAFIEVTETLARAQAQEVDRKVSEGKDPGLLAGVPISIKDIFCIEGVRSTAASRILANFYPPYTATSVEKLQNAGALIVGKVNLDEFTFGSSSESSAFQPCPYNPWDPACAAGGSSGGSAASVGAYEVPLSLGTDTGGSIRQPSAFCGVVGLKPTYGRVSRYGLIAFGSSLDCPGPIARNAGDAALMLQVMAGTDPKDATTTTVAPADYLGTLEKDLRGMRIGLSPDYDHIAYPDFETGEMSYEPLQKEVSQAAFDAAEVLARAGADIVEGVPMLNSRYGIPAYFVISRVEAASNLHRFDGVKYGYRTEKPFKDLNELYRLTRAEGFGRQPKLRILMGMYVSASQHAANYYHKALKVRGMIRRDFDEAFDKNGKYGIDVLLTPSTPTTAFRRKEVFGNTVLMQYSDQMNVCANHAGIPAVTIPAGFDDKGLPLGIQFIGPDYREDLILQAARGFEKASAEAAWRQRRPVTLTQAKEQA
ncbi:MAG: amidase family protein [Anaerolineaceae bacterium]|nr:amidase family protein [Anaerolineaceae bacterium]